MWFWETAQLSCKFFSTFERRCVWNAFCTFGVARLDCLLAVLFLGRDQLDEVDTFCYLVDRISPGGRTPYETSSFVQMTGLVPSHLRYLRRRCDITSPISIQVHTPVVMSVLYCSEPIVRRKMCVDICSSISSVSVVLVYVRSTLIATPRLGIECSVTGRWVELTLK